MNELVFLFDQPPKVGKGCFNEITRMIPQKVIYAFLHGFSETRRQVNWDDGDYGNAEMVELGEDEDTRRLVDELFQKHSEAVFLLCGFKSEIVQYVDSYILSGKYKFVCFSERPGVYGTWWKRLLKRVYIPISEMRIARKYKDRVDAMLPLGISGVKTFRKYGWPQDKLYPFMYDPVDLVTDHSIVPTHVPLRFLYVGRFSRYTKGTDTLLKAVDLLQSHTDRFTLSMVGGYGDMREEVLNWVETKPNVEFLGKWDSNEVGMKMKDYDVCIVPSKFDGWNLLVNEAVRAHIGVIATDEAVSDEVIRYSHSGLVVKAKRPKLLAAAMKKAIEETALVQDWKARAKQFSPQISNAAVAAYVLDILSYLYEGGSVERPECPWLKEINL